MICLCCVRWSLPPPAFAPAMRREAAVCFGGLGGCGFGVWRNGMRATHGGVRPDHPTRSRRDGREADARVRVDAQKMRYLVRSTQRRIGKNDDRSESKRK